MKKIIIVFLLILSWVTANEIKIDSSTEYYKAITNLNVRTGAGKKYPVLSILQKGDEVEALSKTKNWTKIRYLDKTGYVCSKYLEFSGNTSSNTTSQEKGSSHIILILATLFAIILLAKYRGKRNKDLVKLIQDKRRGIWLERKLYNKLLSIGIEREHIFYDLYLQKYNGNFSQIDLVVLTEVGILVFEVKDYRGWIFGTVEQYQWTQVLSYGKQKYRFYNPVLQNKNHIQELKLQLKKHGNIPFFSIIVFYGDCELKNIDSVPERTFIEKADGVFEVIRKIKNDNNPFEYPNKEEILKVLKQAEINGKNSKIQKQHINNIKNMLEKYRVFA